MSYQPYNAAAYGNREKGGKPHPALPLPEKRRKAPAFRHGDIRRVFPRIKQFSFDIVEISVYTICMKRVNYHLTEMQIKQLKELSMRTGLTVAELIRRAIDEYVKRQK